MTTTTKTDLKEEIREAYKSGDTELSKKLHTKQNQIKQEQTKKVNDQIVFDGDDEDDQDDQNQVQLIDIPPEKHKKLGDYIKSIIYGGLDGIITTFAIVAGVQGANLKPEVILVLGFANLIADGLSMGVGDYLSEKAELDFSKSERKREEWEFDHFKAGEIDEMIDIYKSKGIEEKDARLMLTTMAKYRDFFIDHMMIQELELNPPDPHANPMKNGLVTLGSFIVFGMVPLFSYIIITPFNGNKMISFGVSIALTVICLFVLGVVKGKLTESPKIKSGLFVALNGTIAAAASYVIGYGLGAATGLRG